MLAADGTIVVARWNDGAPETIAEFSGRDHLYGLVPGELTADGSGMWFGSYTGSDRMRLARLDLTTGVETEVDSHPELDLDALRRAVLQGVRQTESPLIRHRHTGELLGVRYLGERQVIHALDPHFADVLAKVEQLSDGDLEAISTDDTGTRWVVSFTHDRDPDRTWLYDHSTGASRLLFADDPRLDPAALAPMTPVTITARDGRALPSYLTLPVATEPTTLPLVLLVHGGPWYRDAWGFGPQTQLLANRGYAVLQVNFRGSVGYGNAHTQAAVGEFAGAMHDDLIDAVNWAVGRGLADPERIGIVGGSYGGYATLVAVSFTPDVFAAAVDYVGISDLVSFAKSVPPFVRRNLTNFWGRYVGDPDVPEQAADMAARSPIHRADRIRTPLLVVQGANDVRVVRAESDTIVAALRDRDVEVEYLVKDDEGHGFVNPQNQIDFHRATERFLARHLGGRTDAEPAPHRSHRNDLP
ncbi:alpha/beta hydrolase family protein [Pseudonocardia sp. HH130629-09]|uniref:alpha/beta hydrolase family protein n=1 Tax=Pseudonocardia sp. HH130629-09 TaxID=1641402 RepID=UPI001EE6A06C|nr:S9 family peptidase [Pseudonocardia sp. HH130629-09]